MRIGEGDARAVGESEIVAIEIRKERKGKILAERVGKEEVRVRLEEESDGEKIHLEESGLLDLRTAEAR